MFDDRLELVGGVALMAIVVFSMTPAFWQLIVWLGR